MWKRIPLFTSKSDGNGSGSSDNSQSKLSDQIATHIVPLKIENIYIRQTLELPDESTIEIQQMCKMRIVDYRPAEAETRQVDRGRLRSFEMKRH